MIIIGTLLLIIIIMIQINITINHTNNMAEGELKADHWLQVEDFFYNTACEDFLKIFIYLFDYAKS